MIEDPIEEIEGLKILLIKQFEEGKLKSDFTEAIKTKSLMEQKIKNLKDLMDPYQYSFRKGLADNLGLAYVGIFDQFGTARAVTATNDEHLIIDKNGEVLHRALKFGSSKNGIYAVQGENSEYYFSARYRTTIPLINVQIGYEHVQPFSDDIGLVNINKRWLFINKHGQQLFDGMFTDAHNFLEEYASVQTFSSKWSLIDKTGKPVNLGGQLFFVGMHDLSQGLIAVKPLNTTENQNGWRYIDLKGVEYSETYERCSNFSNGLTIVRSFSDRYKIIDRNMNTVYEFHPEFFHLHADPSFRKIIQAERIILNRYNDTNYYLFDTAGNLILKDEYLEYYGEGVFRSDRSNRYIYFDINGERIFR